MKRILEVFGEPIAHGGEESFVLEISDRLMKSEEYQIDFFTPYYCINEKFEEMKRMYGSQIISYDLDPQSNSLRLNVKNLLYYYLIDAEYDVVHIHSSSTLFLALAAREAKRAHAGRVIVHSHALSSGTKLRRFVLREVLSITLQRCADFCCSCSLAAWNAKFSPLLRRKMHILEDGVDIERFRYDPMVRKSVRNELSYGDRALVVGHIGRFSPEKNQAFLLAVFTALLEREPQARLLFVGDGDDRGTIEDQVHDKGIADKVKFLGNVPNPESYLQAIDVLCLPSLSEGFGIVAVEAQAAGVPVLASSCVPSEIKVSCAVEFLSLGAPLRSWVDSVIRLSKIERKGYESDIMRRHLDIQSTVRRVEDLYKQ